MVHIKTLADSSQQVTIPLSTVEHDTENSWSSQRHPDNIVILFLVAKQLNFSRAQLWMALLCSLKTVQVLQKINAYIEMNSNQMWWNSACWTAVSEEFLMKQDELAGYLTSFYWTSCRKQAWCQSYCKIFFHYLFLNILKTQVFFYFFKKVISM